MHAYISKPNMQSSIKDVISYLSVVGWLRCSLHMWKMTAWDGDTFPPLHNYTIK